MKLSIIIPTFNSGAVLGRALDSIVGQTFTDWEVLIMDGVSTDNTLDVAKSYNNSRIHIYSESDKGIYDAMNKGIKKAQGEWLYFLGSDDWLINNNVLNNVFSMAITDYDVIYGDVEANQLDSIHKGEWSVSAIEYNRCHQAIFYKRTVFDRLGYYNLSFPIWADYDLNLKWFFSDKLKNKYFPLIIAHYSEEGVSSTCTDSAFAARYPYIILTRAKKHLSRCQKIDLISKSLNTIKLTLPQRIHLKFWQLELRQIVLLKRIIFTK